MKAALQKAVDSKDLTRAGLLAAVKSLDTVDYEGMLPAEAGKFGGEPNERVFRQSLISKVDADGPDRRQGGEGLLHRQDGREPPVHQALLPVAS